MTIGARLTIAGIAIVAFALCDLVHEVIGHGLAVFFAPGVSAISLLGDRAVVAAIDSALGESLSGGLR